MSGTGPLILRLAIVSTVSIQWGGGKGKTGFYGNLS
jgi:hypothetical protein